MGMLASSEYQKHRAEGFLQIADQEWHSFMEALGTLPYGAWFSCPLGPLGIPVC